MLRNSGRERDLTVWHAKRGRLPFDVLSLIDITVRGLRLPRAQRAETFEKQAISLRKEVLPPLPQPT